MKVLLYFGNHKTIQKSGIGRALKHQMQALDSVGISYTFDPNDNYDLAHINTYFYPANKVLKKIKKKGAPIIMHGHSTLEDFKDSFRCWKLVSKVWYNKNLLWFYKNADYIITPTVYSKQLIDSYNIATPVEVVSNGINPEEYVRRDEYVNDFKERFGITNEKVIMGVGFYFKRKGIIDFFEIAKKFPDIKFIWFGYLPWILRTSEINKAIRNKPKNVILPGYISSSIIKGCYSYASCLLFPTYEETEGIVLLEGLASSCPVLIRDIGVYKGRMKDGYNCYKAVDNEGFINNINKILNSDNKDLIKNGLDTIKPLTLNAVGEALKKTYTHLIKNYKK